MAGGLKGLLGRLVGGGAKAAPEPAEVKPPPEPVPVMPPFGEEVMPAPLTRLSDLEGFAQELSGDDFEDADGVTIVPDEDTDLGDAFRSIRDEVERERASLRKGRLFTDET